MSPWILSDNKSRVGKFLKKQERVKNRGMVRTKQGATPVGGVFKAHIFAADATHARQAIEVSRAVAADGLSRANVGCSVIAGWESEKNGSCQPTRSSQIQGVGGVESRRISQGPALELGRRRSRRILHGSEPIECHPAYD